MSSDAGIGWINNTPTEGLKSMSEVILALRGEGNDVIGKVVRVGEVLFDIEEEEAVSDVRAIV